MHSRTMTFTALAATLLAGVSETALAARTVGLSLKSGFEPAAQVLSEDGIKDERFVSEPGETRELVFSDGTSITMAQASSLTVRNYSFDPATGEGGLTLRLEAGLYRISGGELNTAAPIMVEAGNGCSITIDNATAIVAVDQSLALRTYMIVGKGVTLTSGGGSEDLFRPGFQTASTCKGDVPAAAARVDQSVLLADADQLAPVNIALISPAAGPDEAAAVAQVSPAAGPDETGTLENLINDPEVEDVNDTDNGRSPGGGADGASFSRTAFNDALNDAGGFGASEPIQAGNTNNDTGSQFDETTRLLIQSEGGRNPGPTLNRFYFGRADLEQTLEENQAHPRSLTSADDPKQPLVYNILGNEADATEVSVINFRTPELANEIDKDENGTNSIYNYYYNGYEFKYKQFFEKNHRIVAGIN